MCHLVTGGPPQHHQHGQHGQHGHPNQGGMNQPPQNMQHGGPQHFSPMDNGPRFHSKLNADNQLQTADHNFVL